MLLAKLASARSTCNSRKVGAVVVRDNQVLATGYNGAVHGAPHCIDKGPGYCFRRDTEANDNEKYHFCVASHAEGNAISQAARFGISLDGAALYCTLEPCNWCLKQLIQAGIREVYYELPYDSKNKDFDSYWRKIIEGGAGFKEFKQVILSKETIDRVILLLLRCSERNSDPNFLGPVSVDFKGSEK